MTWKHIVPGVLLLVVVALALGFYWPFGDGKAPLRLPGIVEIQEVRLGSKVGGRVASIEVSEGDIVEAGRVLVRFDVPELKAQRDQLQARLDAARAELVKAQNGPRQQEKDAALWTEKAAHARLDRIKEGWRDEEKLQAQSEKESSVADLKYTKEEFERADRLFRQGIGSFSRSDWDGARYSYDRAKGRYAAAEARAAMLEKGLRPQEIAEATADWERARANYELLRIGTRQEDIDIARFQVAQTQARLDEIEINLREAEVKAPEKCLVEVLAVRAGDIVTANQPCVRVLRAQDMWVKVYVAETKLGLIQVGQPVSVTVDTDASKRFTGSVMQVAAESEFTPRNVQSVDERRHQVFGVKIRVNNPQGVFKSGMAAEVTFE